MSKLDITRAMQMRGINKATICERTGLASQNINSIITGNPTLKKLQQIADALRCDITELFFPDMESQEGVEADTDTQSPQSPSCPQEGNVVEDAAEHTLDISGGGKQTMQTMAFCPHCGAKVLVGVVLIP